MVWDWIATEVIELLLHGLAHLCLRRQTQTPALSTCTSATRSSTSISSPVATDTMPLFYLPRNNTFLEITKLPRNNTVQCMSLFLLCFSGKKKVIEKITKRNKKTTSRWKIVKNWKSYSKCVVNQHPTFTYNISILWRLAEFYWFLVKVFLLVEMLGKEGALFRIQEVIKYHLGRGN